MRFGYLAQQFGQRSQVRRRETLHLAGGGTLEHVDITRHNPVPQEIAEIALFLGSESSRAVTGQEILADRGWAYS